MEHGLGSVFVMSNHLLRVHPFVGKSFLDINREDLEDEALTTVPNTANEHTGATVIPSDATTNEAVNETYTEGETSAIQSNAQVDAVNNTSFDRRRAFIIDDNPGLGPEVFFATKNVASSGSFVELKKMTAVAVREHRTEKFAKILRFMYTVPSSVENALNTWIAIPKISPKTETTPLNNKRCENNDHQALKEVAESWLSRQCNIITISQRWVCRLVYLPPIQSYWHECWKMFEVQRQSEI